MPTEVLPPTDRWMGSGTDRMPKRPAGYTPSKQDENMIDEILYRRMLADENRQFFAEKAISNQFLYDNIVENVGDYFTQMSVPWPFTIVQTYVGRAFLELC